MCLLPNTDSQLPIWGGRRSGAPVSIPVDRLPDITLGTGKEVTLANYWMTLAKPPNAVAAERVIRRIGFKLKPIKFSR